MGNSVENIPLCRILETNNGGKTVNGRGLKTNKCSQVNEEWKGPKAALFFFSFMLSFCVQVEDDG